MKEKESVFNLVINLGFYLPLHTNYCIVKLIFLEFVGQSTRSMCINKPTKNLFYGVLCPPIHYRNLCGNALLHCQINSQRLLK